MSQTRLKSAAQRLIGNVFLNVDRMAIDDILARHKDGDISESAALSELSRIEKGFSGPLGISQRNGIDQEWNDISRAVEYSEKRYLLKATQQFYIGTFSLPVSILAMLLSLFFGWQNAEGAAVTAGLLGTALASLAAHAYFVLRVHQQASTAAERLAEKKLSLLFLKLAVGTEGEERKSLLEAGTSMFLGHQAPETIPLSSDDLRVLKEAAK